MQWFSHLLAIWHKLFDQNKCCRNYTISHYLKKHLPPDELRYLIERYLTQLYFIDVLEQLKQIDVQRVSGTFKDFWLTGIVYKESPVKRKTFGYCNTCGEYIGLKSPIGLRVWFLMTSWADIAYFSRCQCDVNL